MNLYKEKYIKYKTKYLELKGGANNTPISELIDGYHIVILDNCGNIVLGEGVPRQLTDIQIVVLNNESSKKKLFNRNEIIEIIEDETDLLIGVKNAMIGRRLNEKRQKALLDNDIIYNFYESVGQIMVFSNVMSTSTIHNNLTMVCNNFYNNNIKELDQIMKIKLDENESKIKETDIKLSEEDKPRLTKKYFIQSINEMYEGKYNKDYNVVLEYLIVKLTKNKCGKAIVINKNNPGIFSSTTYTVTNEAQITNDSSRTQIIELLMELGNEYINTPEKPSSKPSKSSKSSKKK
jgi:hypothetical protein